MKKSDLKTHSVSSTEYRREYYESCHGAKEFKNGHGQILLLRMKIALELAKISPDMLILDFGCGRGEILLYCAQLGATAWGFDYSGDAVKIVKDELLAYIPVNLQNKIFIQQSDALSLPYTDNTFDRIFMLDIIEHLYPEQLARSLEEAIRVLKSDGHIIIHTMPNLWYYKYGYPLFRLIERLRGKNLPRDPNTRWPFNHVHVNEQNPIKLKKILNDANLENRVWLQTIHRYEEENNPIIRNSMIFLTKIFPFKFIFCNDIFAVAKK